jgi:hypothetical protein
MRPLIRHFRLLIVAIALIAVSEPLLHSHPLVSSAASSSSSCAVCSSAVRIAPAAPSVDAPRVVVYALTPAATSVCVNAAPLALASRAPPAA